MSIFRKWYWRLSLAAFVGIIACIAAQLAHASLWRGIPLAWFLDKDMLLILVEKTAWVVIGVLSSLFAYHFLTQGGGENVLTETRCRKCGYILRGITEPRCPECGERI